MQTNKKIINSYTVELEIKENKAEYEKIKKKVYSNISEHANIKWFRKWSIIPDEIIEKNYWAEMLQAQILDEMINEAYPKAIKKENIVPTWPATIKELKSTNPLEVIMTIEVLPTIELDEKKSKKIKIKKQNASVEKNEVELAIKEIEKRFTKFEALEWAIAEIGDRITLDTVWFDKKWWKELEQTRVKAFPLVLWSWSFIPWFEDKLVWSKIGDIVEFDITFPSDYHSADFAWKKVFFLTTIFNIEKATKPQWNEDFIEKLRWVKTDFEWFKKIIEDEILKEKQYQLRLQDENKLLEELEKICKIEIGEHLLKHEIDRVYGEHSQNLQAQWIDMKHYLEHIKKDEETYKNEAIKWEALRRLKAELILEKLKESSSIKISDEEVESEVEKILKDYSSIEVKEKLKAKLIPGDTYYEDIRSRLKYSKIIDEFFE